MKYTKKYRNKSKKKFRKTYKRGGEVLGYGATGWVLGNPAYPCNENQLRKLDNYISKIANSEDAKIDLKNELNASRLIKKLTNVDDIHNYFILDIDDCIVNPVYKMIPPYNTAWRTMGNQILDIDNKKMILYKKGDNNMLKILEKNNGFISFHSNNNKILNIAKGIQILQNNDLIHNDIKPENCVLHENTFKIIDLADVRNITRTTIMKTMPYNFPYFPWPAIAAFTAVYVNAHVTLTNFDSNVLLTLYEKGNYKYENKKNYKDYKYYNDEQYSIWMKSTLFDPFTGFIMDDIMNEKINEYAEKLIYQKTFGIVNNVNESNYNEQISKFLLYSKGQHLEQEIIDIDVNDCLKYYSNIVKKIARKGLLKRIDIYSFGMIILTNIYQLIKHLPQPKTDIRQYIVKYYIFGLYNLAFYCCYQTENTPDMNFIVDYFDTLNKLYGYTLTASDNNNTDELTIEFITTLFSDIPDINTTTQANFNKFKNVIPNIEKKLLLQSTSKSDVIRKPGSLKLPDDNSPKKGKPRSLKLPDDNIKKGKPGSLKFPDDNSEKKRKPISLKSPDDNSSKKGKLGSLKLQDDNSPNINSILKEMTKGSLISDDV